MSPQTTTADVVCGDTKPDVVPAINDCLINSRLAIGRAGRAGSDLVVGIGDSALAVVAETTELSVALGPDGSGGVGWSGALGAQRSDVGVLRTSTRQVAT
jgi:hypothetical protein